MGSDPRRAANLALLRRLYDVLESGNTSPLPELLASDVIVRISDAGELSGTFQGVDAAIGLYRAVVAHLGEGFRIPPYEVLVHDETLVVVPAGTEFGDAGRGMDIYRFENGRIAEVWLTTWRPEPPEASRA
jgi:ketosteroid isomerase-like protein